MISGRPPAAQSGDRAAILALLFNALIWGVSWLPFRYLEARGLSSLWATAFVYGVGFAGLLIWLAGSRARVSAATAASTVTSSAKSPATSIETSTATSANSKPFIAEALPVRTLAALALASGLTNVCFNWALTVGPVVRVVLLFYLMPIWAILLARWLLNESVSASAVLRIVLALVGAMAVLWRPEVGFPWPESLPDWLALAGGMFFALTNVLLRDLAQVSTTVRSLTMFGGCFVTATTVAVLVSSMGLGFWPAASWMAWLPAALLLTLVFTASNLALQFGAARLAANVTAVVMLSEVLFASVSALLWGNEVLSLPLLFGGGLIVLAAWLASKEH